VISGTKSSLISQYDALGRIVVKSSLHQQLFVHYLPKQKFFHVAVSLDCSFQINWKLFYLDKDQNSSLLEDPLLKTRRTLPQLRLSIHLDNNTRNEELYCKTRWLLNHLRSLNYFCWRLLLMFWIAATLLNVTNFWSNVWKQADLLMQMEILQFITTWTSYDVIKI